MGVGTVTAEFLIEASQRGVRYGETLTLGRQNLLVSPFHLEKMLRKYGRWPQGLSQEAYLSQLCKKPYYIDDFLKLLGASRVDAMDVSHFEGARIIHDLNDPVSPDLHQRYDVVIDGGLLEHVFNFPVAIKNCMEMVKVGGHLLLVTPANNLFGHGFYQFSPELYYRVLSPENGFEVERMVAMEFDCNYVPIARRNAWFEISGPWFDVRDPNEARSRITLSNRRPVYLHILARRTADVPIFARTPQQSDYVTVWGEFDAQAAPPAEPSIPTPLPPPERITSLQDLWRKFYRTKVDYPHALHLRFYVVPSLLRKIKPYVMARLYGRWSFRNRAFFTPTVRDVGARDAARSQEEVPARADETR